MQKYSNELLAKILVISPIVVFLKDGRFVILLMFLYYLFVKWMEKEEERKQIEENNKAIEEIRKRKGYK